MEWLLGRSHDKGSPNKVMLCYAIAALVHFVSMSLFILMLSSFLQQFLEKTNKHWRILDINWVKEILEISLLDHFWLVVPIIEKPVNWFALQVNWLVSLWWGTLVINGLVINSLLTYKSESSIEQKKVIIIIIWSNNGYQLKIYLTVPWHCYKQKSEVLIFQNVSRTRGGSRTAATYKMERFVIIAAAVNYYHKALHLGCCSSPRPASDYRK